MIIQAEELKKVLDEGKNVLLLDVREPDEYDICHLENAHLIPMRDLPKRIIELNPGQQTVCYCHHGIRSLQAAQWLSKNGFKNVKSLAGGIDQWAERIEPEMERY